ncbi:MAG: hypothetical protein IT209_01565 [Armatimonadetes bacterium]|nr:hypothetical protein [Armatimonadota bacterium]
MRISGYTLLLVFLSAICGAAFADDVPVACYGTYDINVCYSPWRVVLAEPGYTGVVMRKGPSFDAEPIYRPNNTPVIIPIGDFVGRASNRDGGVANNCPSPGPRKNLDGWLWVYWPNYAKQGWIPYSVNGVKYAVGDSSYSGVLCGPAKFDFDCRYPGSACPKYHGCGGSPVPATATCPEESTFRPIIAVGSTPSELSEQKYYLRYGIDSTTYMWLVPGDIVERHCFAYGSGYNWSCVTVVCAKYCPHGARGWVRSDALGAPMSKSAAVPCYNTLFPPDGSGVYEDTPGGAKRMRDGAPVVISGGIVTAAFPDAFYIESTDRSSAVRVEGASTPVVTGQRYDIEGRIGTTPQGERVVQASSITAAGTGWVSPVLLPNASVGGDAWFYDPMLGSGQAGASPGNGLSNVGMLIRTWGVVRNVTASSFSVDDGSGQPITCLLPSGVSAPTGGHVSVTGICVVRNTAGGRQAAIQLRSASDIQPS